MQGASYRMLSGSQEDVEHTWQLPCHSLTVLSKLLAVFPNQNEEIAWWHVIESLLFPHAWVRTAACRHLGLLSLSLYPAQTFQQSLHYRVWVCRKLQGSLRIATLSKCQRMCEESSALVILDFVIPNSFGSHCKDKSSCHPRYGFFLLLLGHSDIATIDHLSLTGPSNLLHASAGLQPWHLHGTSQAGVFPAACFDNGRR